jgi:hypothetical protein
MNRIQLRVAGLLALLLVLAATVGVALAATTPDVSIGTVSLGSSMVCGGSGPISADAVVTPTYDSGSTSSSTAQIACQAGTSGAVAGRNNCGTFDTSILCKKTLTQTIVTVINKSLTVTVTKMVSGMPN